MSPILKKLWLRKTIWKYLNTFIGRIHKEGSVHTSWTKHGVWAMMAQEEAGDFSSG